MTNLVAEANVSEGTFVHRPMTEAEIERDLAFQAEVKIVVEREKIEELQKISARQALLDKLGITEEEARLLLGGN